MFIHFCISTGKFLLQVLALDKRYLDPRRTLNPSQAEKEEGIIPLTDSLPIISQVFFVRVTSFFFFCKAGALCMTAKSLQSVAI